MADDTFSCFKCRNKWQIMFQFECAQHEPVLATVAVVVVNMFRFSPQINRSVEKCERSANKNRIIELRRSIGYTRLLLCFTAHDIHDTHGDTTSVADRYNSTKYTKWKKKKKATRSHTTPYGHWIRMRTNIWILNKYIGNMFLVSSSTLPPEHDSADSYFAAARLSCAMRECCTAECEVWTIARRVTQSILTTWQSIRRSSHTHSMLGIAPLSQDVLYARVCPFDSRAYSVKCFVNKN